LKQPNRMRIRRLIFASLAVFLLSILSLLWLLQNVFFDSFFAYERENHANKLAGQMAALIGDYLANVNPTLEYMDSELKDELTSMAVNGSACVLIVDETAGAVYTMHVGEDCFIHKTGSMEYARLFQHAIDNGGSLKATADTLYYDNSNQPNSMIFCRVLTGPYTRYCLFVNVNIVAMASIKTAMRSQLALVSFAMLALAILLANVIARRISKPMAEMNESAKRLAKGDYKVHFSGGSFRESVELADSLNHAAQELSKVDRLKSDLIANVSHDLRTPLTMITGYAEMARDLPGESTKENLQVIIDEAMRLNSLVNDLLDLSKLQAGAEKLTLTSFSLDSLAESIISRLTAAHQSLKGQIRFEAKGDESHMVIADESKISQVIYNLLTNAINYSGEDKQIALAISTTPQGKTRLEVSDNGQGIPEDILPYIWERYYKADKGYLRSEVGTGLGLSIVRSVLGLHEARYGVDSKVGEGSTFWFEL